MIADQVKVLGATVNVERLGSGPPLLLLHGEDGLLFARPFVEQLAESFSLIVPGHPSWGSPRPRHVRTIDDIAYLYLELLEHLDLQVMLVGTSLGGWLAAEIVTKSDKHVAGVALVAPVGIKTGGREDRAFVDLYATRPDLVTAALYADPANAPDLSRLTEQEMVVLTTAQEAVARYAWEPYMHSPALPFRLARMRVPTLVVAGEKDRFALEPNYYSAFTALIGDNAELSFVPDAGHRVEEEAPAMLCETIRSFFDRRVATSMAGTTTAGAD